MYPCPIHNGLLTTIKNIIYYIFYTILHKNSIHNYSQSNVLYQLIKHRKLKVS